MKERERLLRLCLHSLNDKGLGKEDQYMSRLKKEIKEVDAQAEHEYFLDLYDRKVKFSCNEHNNLIDFLLGLSDEFDVNKESASVQGEFPDIDIDYLKPVRDYLKREWAAEKFGQENICEIGTYGTAGIKSAMLDMTGVHGLSKTEIQGITVKMEDKDDEGKVLEWDKALEMYPEFRAYCEAHEDVSSAANLMQGRNKSGGVHAGGLIISDQPIGDFVPMEVRSVNKANPHGVICSAWTEGLAAQDLQPVGLIKFDLLVINNLMQIAIACHLIKERHGVEKICALPGSWDWSDIEYLNDPASLNMANKADLKCIFQFDSEGIRKLVKRGGVDCFDDMAAYSALYRPGPLGMGMDARYCKRKQGEESYNIHPLMQSILGKTYGVMAYQEQVMDILRVVGSIPDMHTEKVRKAISKKNVKGFIKYKEMFVENGKQNLRVNEDFVTNLWAQIESFAEYGFNKSVDKSTLVIYPGGEKPICEFEPGETVFCVNEDGNTVETEVVAVHDHGVLDAFEVEFDDGYQVTCSADHKFLTEKGQMPLREICRTHSSVCVDKHIGENYVKCEEEWLEDQMWESGENQEVDDQTSQRMFGVSEVGLGQCSSQSTLRNGVQDLEVAGESLQGMYEVRGDQERKYTSQDGEVEQRQRTSRSQEDIFRDSQEDFGSSRDSSSTCCTIEEVAGRESREVCEMHRSSLEKSETISNGGMASSRDRMGHETNSMWRREKTGRFCERQNLDRGGRILSFLQSSLQEQRREAAYCPTTGRNVEGRGDTSRRCDVASDRHDMFQEQFRSDAGGVVRVVSGHAPITNTGGLVSRRVVGVRYVGKRQMCDLEVTNPTHNFLLPNGIVTSNSHSYAYTYISSRLLWLKSHYPIEFYTAILMCEKDDEKFREYKLDAEKHDVNICPVHINRSRENFHIDDNEIYFGFQNIKGLGEAVAQRIVEEQPYDNFTDFLNKFGTDATAIKALTALGVFDEGYDRVTLRKFSEFFKDSDKKRRERKKRFEQAMDKKLEELKAVLLDHVPESDPDLELMSDYTEDAEKKWEERFYDTITEVEYKTKGETKTKDVTVLSILQGLSKRRGISLRNFHEKETEDTDNPITLDQFNPASIKLDEEEEKILKNDMELDGNITYPMAEGSYYGFQWTHELETSPDFSGRTFDVFFAECEVAGNTAGMVEVKVKSIKHRVSKNDVEFKTIELEDANARVMKMNFWMDDYIRWHDEIAQGNMIKIRVRPPSGGFNTLTFDSVPKHKRRHLPPKEEDHRIRPMKLPERSEDKTIDLDDMQFELV